MSFYPCVGFADVFAGRVVVLFTDLMSSTTLRVELGEARFEGVLADHDRLIAEAVSSAAGVVV